MREKQREKEKEKKHCAIQVPDNIKMISHEADMAPILNLVSVELTNLISENFLNSVNAESNTDTADTYSK